MPSQPPDARQRLAAVLEAAQREPVVIRRRNRNVAVVISVEDYERLRNADVQVFLELRDQVAAEAAAQGLTDEQLAGTSAPTSS